MLPCSGLGEYAAYFFPADKHIVDPFYSGLSACNGLHGAGNCHGGARRYQQRIRSADWTEQYTHIQSALRRGESTLHAASSGCLRPGNEDGAGPGRGIIQQVGVSRAGHAGVPELQPADSERSLHCIQFKRHIKSPRPLYHQAAGVSRLRAF